MKKILFFVESLHCGGAERSLLSLLNNLDYSGYDVHLMVLKRGGEFEKFVPSHLSIKSIDYQPGIAARLRYKISRLLDTGKKYHLAQHLWRSIRSEVPVLKERYDIAISWGQGFATYFVAEKVTADKKFAWVNIDYRKAGYNPERDLPLYNRFTKIIGVSEFVKMAMQEFVDPSKVISIRNIIDPDDILVRADEAIPEVFDHKKINLVSVGRLAKQKGFELAIAAAKILVEKGYSIYWRIIGEGSERTLLENLILKEGLGQNIELSGFRANPYPYIKEADIYVQTSWFEGLGRTIIEAGILCKPIVTTEFPTAHAILEHEKTGLIVPMIPEAIASGIQKIIDDNELRESFEENLRKQSDDEKAKTLKLLRDLFEGKI